VKIELYGCSCLITVFVRKSNMVKAKKDDLFETEVDMKKLVEKILEEKDKRNEADERIKELNEELMEGMHTLKKKDLELIINDTVVTIYLNTKEKITINRA